MNSTQNLHSKHNEQGSALLITLGILALVMILAVTFVFSSRTELKVAKANADATSINLMLESAATHVVRDMTEAFVEKPKKPKENPDIKIFPPQQSVSSPTITSFNDHRLDDDSMAYSFIQNGQNQPSDFKEQLQDHHPLYKKISSLNFNLDNAQFHYIKNQNGKIIGRYAYLIVADGEKLDLNQMVTPMQHDVNPNVKLIPYIQGKEKTLTSNLFKQLGSPPTKPFFYYNLDANYFEEKNKKIQDYCMPKDSLRLGLIPQELYPRKELSSGKWKIIDLNFISNNPNNPNNPAAVIPWISYTQLLGLNNNDPSLFKNYRLFSLNEPEAFLKDDKECSRFDIIGYEQSTSASQETFYVQDGEGKMRPDKNDFWETVAKPEQLCKDDPSQFPNVSTNIPYLKDMVDKDGNKVGLQVAANLIDYSDRDNKATVSFSEDFLKKLTPVILPQVKYEEIKDNDVILEEPNYWGNEQVPYFNEIQLHVKLKREKEPKEEVQILSLTPQLEMVNIFKSDFPQIKPSTTVKQNIYMYIFYKIYEEKNPVKNHKNYKISFCKETEFMATGTDYQTIDFTSNSTNVFPITINGEDLDTFEITSIVVYSEISTIPTVGGTSGTPIIEKKADYATFIPTKSDYLTHFKYSLQLKPPKNTVEHDITFSLEAKDPRYNHRTNGWKYNENGSLGSENQTFPPPPDRGTKSDSETYDSVHFSTAYIKNKPMETFWELGAIHRGEPFRTINLNNFDTNSSGKYEKGDAGILDQLKIGPLQYVKGRYNANANNLKAIKTLLNGIDPGIDLPPGVDSPYDVSAMKFSPCPKELDFTTDRSTDLNRGIFVNRLDTTGFTNDRDREAFIGRTANLLTTRCDPYTVLIVAQALKKIDEKHYDNVKKSVDNDMDRLRELIVNPLEVGDERFSIMGTKTMTLYLIRDAWTNQFTTIHREIHNR